MKTLKTTLYILAFINLSLLAQTGQETIIKLPTTDNSSSFNITMVLLNANQIHTYHAVIMSNHNNNDIQNHIAAVIST